MTTIPATHPLATVDLFAALDLETLDALMAESRVRTYPKGQILCSEGDPGDELLLLESGYVRVSRFGPDGHEVVVANVEAPTAIGELALIDGKPRAATLIAASEIRIRYFRRRALLALIEREPAVAMALLQAMATMVRATNERLSDVLALDVPGRLAKWLLAHGAESGRLTLDQSQESLALQLGTTRVTVNRSLRRLERLGLIEVQGAEIRLCDIAALQSIVDG